MDVGRHGTPIGIASRNERLLRALERRFSELVPAMLASFLESDRFFMRNRTKS